ncbi:MAG TPA: Ig-like domain-containing protein, partial [Solirubrobacteraceae bacterium]|nr:Ig-like domain-containing protein [Solirubrobacteraceae bacterium]
FACDSPFTPTALDDGEHTITVTAADAAGNVDPTPASRTFTVDTTGPQTTFDGGPAEGEGTSDTTPTFAFSSSEAGSTFACSIDAGEPVACDSPFTAAALADGEHTFAVAATDALGNTAAAPAVRTFTVDTAAPQTAVADGPPEGGTTTDSTPAFAFSSDAPGSTFECSIDGGAAFDCASPYTPTALADGEHTFAVTAIDASGNRDPTPTTRSFRVTATPAPAPVPVPAAAPAPRPAAVTVPAVPAPAALLPCVSRRKFPITLRPAGVRLVAAVVRVNHKRVAIRRSGGRLRATVDLRGLPKRTYTVTIDARDARGRHYRETRRYRVC